MVGWISFLLLLSCSAWLCLGPALQDLPTFFHFSVVVHHNIYSSVVRLGSHFSHTHFHDQTGKGVIHVKTQDYSAFHADKESSWAMKCNRIVLLSRRHSPRRQIPTCTDLTAQNKLILERASERASEDEQDDAVRSRSRTRRWVWATLSLAFALDGSTLAPLLVWDSIFNGAQMTITRVNSLWLS